MSWRSRLENTQNHAPEDLGMTELAYKDVGKAVKRIKELEQELRDANCSRHNLHKQWREKYERLRSALEKIASRRPRPLPGKCSELYGIAEQALKGPERR